MAKSARGFRLLLLVGSVLTVLVVMASFASAGPEEEEVHSHPEEAHSHAEEPDSHPVVRGCSAFDPAADRRADQDLFDPEVGKLTVETPDAVYVMYEHDQTCTANPRTQHRLEQAREMADNAYQAMCEDFRRAVAEGATELNGRRINLDAAQRALEGRCAQWLR